MSAHHCSNTVYLTTGLHGTQALTWLCPVFLLLSSDGTQPTPSLPPAALRFSLTLLPWPLHSHPPPPPRSPLPWQRLPLQAALSCLALAAVNPLNLRLLLHTASD